MVRKIYILLELTMKFLSKVFAGVILSDGYIGRPFSSKFEKHAKDLVAYSNDVLM